MLKKFPSISKHKKNSNFFNFVNIFIFANKINQLDIKAISTNQVPLFLSSSKIFLGKIFFCGQKFFGQDVFRQTFSRQKFFAKRFFVKSFLCKFCRILVKLNAYRYITMLSAKKMFAKQKQTLGEKELRNFIFFIFSTQKSFIV